MTNAVERETLAAHWLSRREDEGWTEQDQAALDAWLEEAVENKMAYWRLEYGWRQTDRMAALRSPAQAAPVRALVPRRWRPALAAASLAACVMVGAPVLWASLSDAKTYRTEVGGRAVVPLQDGSRVELNTATRLRAAVGPKARTVWLDRGEAYFEIKHDPSRPFVVHAGNRTVTVLGTKFSVRREGDRVEVAVVEGRVQVDLERPRAAQKPAVLTRGDIVVAEGPSTLRASSSNERVADELSWRKGVLTFEQTPLDEAAREFNRYNATQLSVDGAAASAIRIDGSFEARNVEAFARLMRRGYGLKVEQSGDRITISE